MPLLIVLAAAAPARAQRLELRAGAALSSPLARDAVGGGGSAVTLRPQPAPELGLAALLPLRPRLALELSAAAAPTRLRGEDASGASWPVQTVTVGQALLGLRLSLPGRRYLRGAMGGVRYFGSSAGIFAQGSTLRPALEAGGGWQRPLGRAGALGPLLGGAELVLQAHTFQTQTLQQARADAGTVGRVALLFTLSRAGER